MTLVHILFKLIILKASLYRLEKNLFYKVIKGTLVDKYIILCSLCTMDTILLRLPPIIMLLIQEYMLII